jgi:hypothetical protein
LGRISFPRSPKPHFRTGFSLALDSAKIEGSILEGEISHEAPRRRRSSWILATGEDFMKRIHLGMTSVPALLILITICMFLPQSGSGQTVSVSTWHNDNARDGQNTEETILTTSNVNSTTFGKLFTYAVDGQVYAQPLYIPKVPIPGQGIHNVVYVATENDSVYAFDADGLSPLPLWQVSLLLNGGVAVPCSNTGACPVNPIYGITSTPVIDLANSTIYVVAFDDENGSYFDRLHALNLTTGAEKFGGPVVIQASVAGTGSGSVDGVVTFNPLLQLQRPGLLLLNGVIYIGWGSFGDLGIYNGWVMGYNASTLAQTAVFNTTPNGSKGAVWQSGGGLSTDSSGHIFVQTANGTFDAAIGGVDYGDSFLKLNPTGLTVVDYFTPRNELMLESDDLDLGSGAGLILPQQAGSFPNEITSADKQGLIYVVNRSNMGKFSSTANHNIQTLTGSVGGYVSSPAYWNSAVFYSGVGGFLSRYTLTSGLLSTTPVSKAPTAFKLGSTPSISADGATNGIVWAIDAGGGTGNKPAVLHAYDATNVATELYNTNQAGTRDQPGGGIKFSVPTIANGKVYIGTFTELAVYGLLTTQDRQSIATSRLSHAP